MAVGVVGGAESEVLEMEQGADDIRIQGTSGILEF